ncbi:MAG: AAA family ATPase [Atribacterota bacterium]
MIIKKTTFKNFLSYGNKKQEFVLKEGLNLIRGIVPSKSISNTSGKSNILSSIPVALYGREIRGLRQEQLINWKNKKNCELEILFDKGNNEYLIRRGFKPNYLEIYENGKEIPGLPSIRDIQNQIDEIVGLDFSSFMSLVFFNLNYSEPFMKMSKPDKRKFMEKLFNLEMFTQLSDWATKKINELTTKVNFFKSDITKLKVLCESLGSQNIEMVKKIEKLKDSSKDISKVNIEDVRKINQTTINMKNQYELNVANIEKKLSILSRAKYSISHINGKINQIKEDYETISNLKKKRPDGDKKEFLNNLKNVEEKEQKVVDMIEKVSIEIKDLEKCITEEKTTLKIKENQLDLINNNDVCPTCSQEIKKKKSLTKTLEKEIIDIKKSINRYSNNLIEKDKELHTAINEREKFKETKDSIKDSIKFMISVDEQIKDITKRSKIHMYKKYIKALDNIKKVTNYDHNDLEKNRYRLNKKIKELEKEIEEHNKILNQVDVIEYQEKVKNEMEEIIKGNKKQIVDNEKIIEKNEKEIKRFNSALDHFSYIKNLCKDENVKQFAISSRIPYIASKTNEYLAYVGHDFYVELDKWMDMNIKGPGIYNCSYANLCGGESKSIDIALLMAFHDVSRSKSLIKTDILVLDELLDTSVDGPSLDKVVDIIRTKQRNNNLKLYVVSHRNEIDVDFDNIYTVVKEGGYSKLYEGII